MAKKDLSTSEWRPDDDLDFNFGDEIGTGMPQESKKKSRSAVTSMAYGIGDGLKSKATDASLYKRILRNTLPRHYGEVADAATDVTGGLYELYDQTQKEVKPRLNRLTKSLDKFVPEESKTLKKLMGKIVDLTGGRGSEMTSPDTSAQEDQSVNMMLGEIFQAQTSASKIGETRAIMRDAIESKRYKGSMDISLRMQRDISVLQQYTTNVTQAFQKKSLELQLRTYLGQRAYYTKSLQYMEIFRKQNDAVMKNTGLPDTAKITEIERLKTIGKEKMMGSLYGDGSTWKNGLNRLKKSAGDYVQGMGMRMDMAEMGIDMAHMGMEQMKEMNAMLADMGLPPMTKAQMAGAAAAGWAVDEAADWASPKLKAYVAKHPGVSEKLALAARFAMNPGSKVKEFRNSESWKAKTGKDDVSGKMFKFLDFLMEHFEDRAEGSSFTTGSSNDELLHGKGFDQRAHLSLTTVIPGYLSMIHREMTSLRSGQDQPYLRYDFQAGRFRTDKAIQAQVVARLKETAQRSGYSHKVSEAGEALTKDHEASDREKDTLKNFISKLSRISNVDYTSKGIRNTEPYKALSSEDQDTVDRFFSLMEEAPNKQERMADFTKSMVGIRRSTPNYQEDITDIIRSGHGDLLAKSGIVKQSADGYAADPDDLHRFTEEHAGRVGSDMNIKEDIKGTTPAGLLKSLGKKAYEGIQKTKLYNWKYKKGAGDQRLHAGPMAQDVQKNLGNEAAPNGKEIDLQTMNGSFFASIQYLGSRIEDLFKGKKTGTESKSSDDHLKNIDTNVARIAALTVASGGSGGLGGTGYREGFSLDYFLDKGIDGVKSGSEAIKNGAGVASNKIAELWGNNKDKLKEKAIWLFNKGSDLAGTIFDAGSNFIKNTIPDWANKAKDFGKKVLNTIGEQFMVFQDLYLPDGTEPIIRAAKLKAGEYYDEVSGAAITTMDEVLKAKGNIVDKAGNVIVSAKELSRGLVDRYGEKARTMAGTAAAFAISGVKKLGGSLLKAGGQLTEMMAGGFSKVKEWWDNSPELKFPDIGGAFIGKKHLAELINIRDILLGDAKDVRKRIKKSAMGKGSGGSTADGSGAEGGGGAFSSLKEKAADLQSRYAVPGSFLGNLLGKAKGYGGKAAAMATVATRGNDFTGPMTREEMEASQILEAKKAQVGGRFSSIKDYAQKLLGKKGPDEGFVGPMQESKWGKLGGKLRGGFSTGKSRLGGLLTMASGYLAGDPNRPSPGALTDGADGQTDQQKEAAAHDAAEPAVIRRKRGTVAQKDRAAGDDDGDGVKDSSVEAQRNKVEELRAQRDKKTLAADTSAKYKSPENVLDTIAKKASDLMGTLSSGLGSVFNLAGMLFSGGKSVTKGIMGTFSALGRGASALGGLTGGGGAGFGTAARAAWMGVRAYGAAAALSTTAAGSGAVAFGGLALSAATAVTGTVLSALTSAVVAVPLLIAGATYGLYKLYQYSNHDNASEMEHLRLRQYGFGYNTAVDRYNHHVYLLESYLEDGRLSYDTRGYPSILTKNVNIKELLSIFEIDEKDSEGVTRFNGWFNNRFKPVFFAHTAALFKVDKKKKLHEVNDLNPSQKLTYLEQAKFKNGPYSYDISPLGEKLELDVNSDEVMQSYDNLILKVMAEIKKTAKKHPGIDKPEAEIKTKLPDKTNETDQKVAGLKAGQENSKANQGLVGKDATGEGDGTGPKAGSDNTKGSAPGSVNMASGPLLSGENGMQFINLKAGSRLDGLSPGMLRKFLAMAEEYGQLTGKTIPVESGYRSFEQQKALWMRDPSKAAKPGHSLHEYGLALDIGSKVADELDQLGLMKKYGFTRPVGGEPWHMEPAGIQKSIDLAKNNAVEREQMIEFSAGRGGGGAGSINGSPLGKRNHELAMKLLDVPSKLVDNKSEQSKDVAKTATDKQIVKEESKPTSVTPSTVKAASNDASYSKTANLQSTKMGDINAQANQGTVSPETESGKSDGTGASGAGDSSDLARVLDEAARKTGMSADLLKTFAAVESGMDPSARSKTSSALGLMQFMPATWNETLSKYGGKYGLASNASPFDANASALMGAEYLKSNMRLLANVRPNPNAADMYLMHLLGAGGARKFFQADPGQLASEVLGKQATSNPELFFGNGRSLTVGEAYERIKQRVKEKATAFGLKADLSGPGLKAPKAGEPSQGIKLPSSGGVDPKVSGPEPVAPETKTKRGFNFDNTSAGYVSQPNQSGQRNDAPSSKVEALMEKSNDTAMESLKALQSIVSSLSEERLAKVLAAVVSVLPKQESKEEAVKVKDKENMGRTATARGSSLDLQRRTSA